MRSEIFANCECGALSFKSSEQPVLQICCHCSDCRDATQSDFSTIAFFKSKRGQVDGNIHSKFYVAESGCTTQREACSACGSMMFDKSAGFPGLIGVFSDYIQAPFKATVNSHVWVKSKTENTVISQEEITYEEGLA
jgi:hypothetical protein